MSPTGTPKSTLAVNRKARRDYVVLDRHEAGIELRGTEVKSIRAGQATLTGAFGRVEGNELFIYSLTIPTYEYGNRFNHEPTRPRRLLMHKREIRRLAVQTEQKGCSVIPLSLYLKKGKVKIEVGVCRGKRESDKRETLRRRTADREAAREIAHHGR